MTRVPFYKLHGLGNDFLVFDGVGRELPISRLTAPEVAALLCRRQVGVGADGLLLVLPPGHPDAHARMRVINADGSEPEMCGNGIRCVAKVLHDHVPACAGATELRIETGAGLRTCRLTVGGDGRVVSVRVEMGAPALDRSALSMRGEGRLVEEPLTARGSSRRWTAVSMGNPHIVSFVDDPACDLRALAADLGPAMESHPEFPRRTNVEFARVVEPGAVEVWVWERGCGLTLACGTGACATAVAAVVTARHDPARPLEVRLPGGALRIEVAKDLSQVWMDGPAVEVFRGELELDALA